MKLLFIAALPLLTASLISANPRDCSELHTFLHRQNLLSGVYTIYPARFGSGVEVYCDMDTEGGPWTVFQRRLDGTLNFNNPWEHYKKGFGDPKGEYWLGLDNIYQLTSQGSYELRVDMADFEGNKAFARYSNFSIDAECKGYTLNVTGFTSGGAGDSLSYHNGYNFSTFDNTQFAVHSSCPHSSVGGFWYRTCLHTNPNGVYRWGYSSNNPQGVVWLHWKGSRYSLRTFSMMIHKKN